MIISRAAKFFTAVIIAIFGFSLLLVLSSSNIDNPFIQGFIVIGTVALCLTLFSKRD
jgi:uncharacterized membrane protein